MRIFKYNRIQFRGNNKRNWRLKRWQLFVYIFIHMIASINVTWFLTNCIPCSANTSSWLYGWRVCINKQPCEWQTGAWQSVVCPVYHYVHICTATGCQIKCLLEKLTKWGEIILGIYSIFIAFDGRWYDNICKRTKWFFA